MKIFYTLLTLLSFQFISAQSVVTFEDALIEQDSFLNGSDGSGGFAFENIFLPNDYNTEFMSWTGWALTNETDNTTPGFFNQYASIGGSGNNGSENYATTFVLGQSIIDIQLAFPNTDFVGGLYVNNSTYAYFSMLEGDAFAKKFGGETGNDPDYFLLTIKAINQGIVSVDSINFYLADYRFDDNSMDYILNEWTYIDVKELGLADQLVFSLSSSDVGQFGMNTPAYFCVDDIQIEFSSSSEDLEIDKSISIYPNPVSHLLKVKGDNPVQQLDIYSLTGQKVISIYGTDIKAIDVSSLEAGPYVANMLSSDKKQIRRFVKI